MGLFDSLKSTDELYNIGLNYYNQKDYVNAIKYFQQAANKNHAWAQGLLGECYNNGYGVNQNYNTAFYWYQLSANNGCVWAIRTVGFAYSMGKGVVKDDNMAFKYFLQAAKLGDMYAQKKVGFCYSYGDGVEKNAEQAFFWNLKAAENGHSGAQSQVGADYFYGSGVQKDLDKSLEWYTKAINNGKCTQHELLHVSEIYYYLNDYYNAAEYYHKYAEGCSEDEKNNFYELFNDAERYYYGNGVIQDYRKASEYYHKIASMHINVLQKAMQSLHEITDGINNNYDNDLKDDANRADSLESYSDDSSENFEDDEYKNVERFFKAAEQGNASAQFEMYLCYLNGRGVEADSYAAIKWLKESAKNNYPKAQVTFANHHYVGDVYDVNYKQAFKWYKKAAETSGKKLEYFPALRLAECYFLGRGTEKNLDEAKEWYEFAKRKLQKSKESPNYLEAVEKRLREIGNIIMSFKQSKYYNDEIYLDDIDSLLSDQNNYDDNSSSDQDTFEDDYNTQNTTSSSPVYYSSYTPSSNYTPYGNTNTMNDLYADMNTSSAQNNNNNGSMNDLYSDLKVNSVQKNNDDTNSGNKKDVDPTPVQNNKLNSKNTDTIHALAGVIEQIVNLKGISIFNDTKFFLNIFSDLAPQYKAERMQLEFAFSGEIVNDILNKTISDEVKLNRIKTKIRDLGMNDEIVEKISLSIAKALKWNVEISV